MKIALSDKITYVNGTEHVINIRTPSGVELKIEPFEEGPIRVFRSMTKSIENGFNVGRWVVDKHNLPEFKTGTINIVSDLVRTSFPDRKDLVSPNTKTAKRYSNGDINFIKEFITN